jgi:ligand-binding sensor domain-containing protein/two-component sensor histidine kinase
MRLPCILILSLMVTHFVFGQERTASRLFDHAVFQNYTMKDGLASNYCYDVLQDERGTIWIATLNGLNRFNGNRWETYQQQTEGKRKQLPANWVIDIDEEKGKNIWINTDGGIATCDLAGDSVYQFPEPVKGWGKISVIRPGQILVSAWTGLELFKKDKNKLHSIQTFPETNSNSFPLIYRGSYGSIWTCPEDRPSLVRFNTQTGKLSYIRSLNFGNQTISPVIKGILQLNRDQLLLATRQNGILLYTISTNRAKAFFPKEFPVKTQYGQLIRYQIGKERFLLIGTQSQGLFIWNENTHQCSSVRFNSSDPKSLCSNQIMALYADNNDGVWIATGMGISYFHPSLQKNKSYHFHNREAFPDGILINTVLPLRGNSFLIGTENNGLFIYDSNSDNLTTIKSSLTQISCITRTDLGILVGSGKGVFRFHPTSGKLDPKALIPENTLKIRKLDHSIIACCTQKGLQLYDGSKQRVIFREKINPDAPEKSFCKDVFLKNGKIWILRFFDGWEVREYPSFKPLFVSKPSTFPIDYHGIQASGSWVYIATSTGIIQQQISKLTNIKHLKTADGLVGDEIENIVVTGNDEMFYTTVDGLYFYSHKKKTSRRLASYENYVQKWYNQLELTDRGTLLYSVSDYFCNYNIRDPYRNRKTPDTDIEKILVNDRQIPLTDKLNLDYRENTIRIFLASHLYPESTKNKWVYQLNKQESKTCSGLLELQNLPPDDYTLTYFTVNNEGVRSRFSKSLFIRIAPPFYNTWWFPVLVFLFICTLFGLFYTYKRAQNIRLLQIRNQISRDLHDELGANVSSINIMANMLQSNPGSANAQTALDNISRYSVQISDTINDIIWNINPKFDSIDELIKRMTRYASETIESAGIEYDLILPAEMPVVKLDNQTKYHLYLIFKESVNNAVKHSKAKYLEIAFQMSGKQFGFSVKDNGTGFDTTDKTHGNGIHNLFYRAKEIDARISLISKPGSGTNIQLTIQLI